MKCKVLSKRLCWPSASYVLAILCIIGFILQTRGLISQYASGKTIVNMIIGRLKNQTLPAITICPSQPILAKLATMDVPYFKDKYKQYMDQLPNNTDDVLMDDLFGQLDQNLTKLYEEVEDELVLMVNRGKLDGYDILKNYTGSFNESIQRIELLGTVNRDNNLFKGCDIEEELADIVKNQKFHPIESLLITPRYVVLFGKRELNFDLIKCFTFFSQLDSYWRNKRFDFFRVWFNLYFDPNTNQYSPQKNVLISIHSPNNMPDLSAFKSVKPDKQYILSYSQFKIKRLRDDQDTHCTVYDRGYLRSDCRFECYQQLIKAECNNSKSLKASYMLAREAYLAQYRHEIIMQDCIESEATRESIMLKCRDICQRDCTHKFHPFQLDSGNMYDTFHTKISLQHNELPDITVKEIQEMHFTTFVCNFGGLLGMWLGLSFLSIIKHILIIMHNIIMKKKQIILNNAQINLKRNITFNYFNKFKQEPRRKSRLNFTNYPSSKCTSDRLFYIPRYT